MPFLLFPNTKPMACGYTMLLDTVLLADLIQKYIETVPGLLNTTDNTT